ncbi:MAG TPA: large conductance mechanosensitive channel protein MscL [Pseudogracilibacillus sp.]|nr:large conductance mechanosensitive channel protein MscL [Pseudogracilibacillus sp.]
MWEDFKNFAFQGNLIDLAVAVVIGAAFGEIVTALVDNIIMPLIGVLMNGVSFTNLTWQVGEASVTYGVFLQSVLDFVIIALSIFLFLRIVLRKKQEEEEEAEIEPQEQLLTEIRDLLKEQHNDSAATKE